MQAPFHADLAEAPEGGDVFWQMADDGVRLRLGFWHPKEARGTILLFPGRTEYIEKYGRVISALVERGYAVAAIDWRGHGYSDRLADDPALGHVGSFADYQRDVRALVEACEKADLPQPWYLLCHSLGGNIGLRALLNGLDVQRAVFSAPMWGIMIPKSQRLTAAILPTMARLSGKGLEYVPGSTKTPYVIENGFEDNLLTTDKDHFAYFARLEEAALELALGGPSIHWFGEAQAECSALMAASRPDVRALVFLGSLEGIVDPEAVQKVLATWPNAEFCGIDGARHELMMEAAPARQIFLKRTFAFLEET